MSGRKSFILKFYYLFHPRGGVQNPDNRVNTRRLEKLIFAWCFPSLVTWRGDVLCGFPHVSVVSRTRSTLSLEVPAGEAKGRLDSILHTVVSSPGLTFVHWPSILPLITQWTKRQSSATLCFLFQKEMRFVSPVICGDWSQRGTSGSCMNWTCIPCASSARWSAVRDTDVNVTVLILT